MRALAALPVAILLAISACGGDESSDGSGTEAADAKTVTQAETPSPRFSRFVELTRCSARDLPHGGGYDVAVRGLRCAEVGRLLPRFGLPISRNDPNAGIFERAAGWTCWAQYLDDDGPVQNVCWRGEQLVVYKYA